MTGAPIPDGADAVVPHEETDAGRRTDVGSATRPSRLRQSVLPRGREMRAGEVVAPGGHGHDAGGGRVACGRRPVGSAGTGPAPRSPILATGDELVEPPTRPGRARSATATARCWSRQAAGPAADVALPRHRPRRPASAPASDPRRPATRRTCWSWPAASRRGSSTWCRRCCANSASTIHFHKVRLKPGKPLFFGTRGDTLVFGLPGNPVSSFVGFELFVRPALRKMAGHAIPGPSFLPVPLAEPFDGENDRPTYAPATVEVDTGWRARRSRQLVRVGRSAWTARQPTPWSTCRPGRSQSAGRRPDLVLES